MKIHGREVKGLLKDKQTRCEHYHTAKDVIAIKFPCCQTYYPCHACHEETAQHSARVWKKEEFDHKAVLCGCCGRELTIDEYLKCGFRCPQCGTEFNPNCRLHYSLYFAMDQ